MCRWQNSIAFTLTDLGIFVSSISAYAARICHQSIARSGFLILAIFAQNTLAEDSCPDLSGIWMVTESVTLTITTNGDSDTISQNATGSVEFTQDGCTVQYFQSVPLPEGGTLHVERTGTITGNTVKFSGIAAIVQEGVTCSENSLTVVGTINGNRIDANSTINIQCSIPGLVQTVTGQGTAIFIGPPSDQDSDTIADENDNCPETANPSQANFDGDSEGDACDLDDDNDSVLDELDAFPFDATESVDTDGDGTGNNADTDDDNDGVADPEDAFPLDPGRFRPRLSPIAVIELPVIGLQLRSPFGELLVVPSTVTAVSLNVTAVDPIGAGFITVWPCGVARPLASNLNYLSGDIVPNGVIASVGNLGSMCFYSLSSTDLIVDISGWIEGTSYVGATPKRLVDTRDGTGGVLGPINRSTPLTIQITDLLVLDAFGDSTTIPPSIGAVALNVTAVQPSSSGFLTLWPCDVARPLSSNLNYTQSDIVANGVIAPVSAEGTVCLYSQAPTDIVVDLAGWFPGQSFTSTTPTRLVDTRDGTGGSTGPITSTDELSVPIHNITLFVDGQNEPVPVIATAAALNVTIVNPTRSGFATVWPCGVSRPLASNLNFTTGQVVANNVIAPIGKDGSVCVYTNVPADIVVDITGWFTDSDFGKFVGATPQRFVDTRDSTGPAPNGN